MLRGQVWESSCWLLLFFLFLPRSSLSLIEIWYGYESHCLLNRLSNAVEYTPTSHATELFCGFRKTYEGKRLWLEPGIALRIWGEAEKRTVHLFVMGFFSPAHSRTANELQTVKQGKRQSRKGVTSWQFCSRALCCVCTVQRVRRSEGYLSHNQSISHSQTQLLLLTVKPFYPVFILVISIILYFFCIASGL